MRKRGLSLIKSKIRDINNNMASSIIPMNIATVTNIMNIKTHTIHTFPSPVVGSFYNEV